MAKVTRINVYSNATVEVRNTIKHRLVDDYPGCKIHVCKGDDLKISCEIESAGDDDFFKVSKSLERSISSKVFAHVGA